VILYQALCDRLPFEGPTWAELQARVITADPTPPDEVDARVPLALSAVCLQALAKEPEERYPHAGALADDLDAWLSGGVVSVEAGLRRQRQLRRLLVGLTLLLLSLLGGVAALRLRKGVPPPAPSPSQARETPSPDSDPTPAPAVDLAAQREATLAWEAIELLEDEQRRLREAWAWLEAHPAHPAAARARRHVVREGALHPLLSVRFGDQPVRTALTKTLLITHARGLTAWSLSSAAEEVTFEAQSVPNLVVLSERDLLLGNARGVERHALASLGEPVWTTTGGGSRLALSPDRERLAACSTVLPVQVLDTATGAVLFELPQEQGELRGLVFTDSAHLVFNHASSPGDLEEVGSMGPLKRYHVERGEVVRERPVPVTTARGLAASPNGERLALGSTSGDLLLLDAETLEDSHRFLDPALKGKLLGGGAYAGSVTAVVFAGDEVVLTVPGDGVPQAERLLKRWSVEDGSMSVLSTPLPELPFDLVVSPDGRLAAIGYRDGLAEVWVVSPP
jgi:hypothetical protein